MSRLEHPLSQEELMAYADGQLKGTQASKVATHIVGCPPCAAAIAEARQLSQQMSSWKVEESPERFAERVLTELNLRATAATRSGWWTRGRVLAYGFSGTFVALALLMSALAPSLLRSRQSAQEVRQSASSAPQELQEEKSSVATPAGPMVIRTIKLNLVTREFDAARARIDAVVRQAQGYIDRLNVRGEAGSARTLSATLRLPASQADSGSIELKKLGRLIEESQNSSDVTSQYVDLAARLSNARNSEQRLLGLLRERAGSLKDVVEMEREIASVRENIERMDAQQKDFNNKVQFVTIQLELSEEYHAQLQAPAPSTGTQIRNASVDGIRSAVDTAVDITLFALRYGPALLIWFVVLGLISWSLWRLRLRISQKEENYICEARNNP